MKIEIKNHLDIMYFHMNSSDFFLFSLILCYLRDINKTRSPMILPLEIL